MNKKQLEERELIEWREIVSYIKRRNAERRMKVIHYKYWEVLGGFDNSLFLYQRKEN